MNEMQSPPIPDLSAILRRIMRPCRDDGRKFTDTGRLDEIQSLLWNSRYRRVNPQGLFHLYAARPLDRIESPVVLVTSHVDCSWGISSCFCEDAGDGLLRGTFDNAATNAVILSLMLEGSLPGSVLAAFTGDEEEGGHGITGTVRFLRARHLDINFAVVLDVTDMGWEEHAGFTVENNFWNASLGRKVIERVSRLNSEWRFVPENPEKIPPYVPPERVVHVESEPDESWLLDELDVPCFSLCLPVRGNMHSSRGVLAARNSFPACREAIKAVLCGEEDGGQP